MNIKVTKQTETGLNTEFQNVETGYRFTLDHALKQIDKGNSNFDNFHKVQNGDVTYLRSNPDSKKSNNIE